MGTAATLFLLFVAVSAAPKTHHHRLNDNEEDAIRFLEEYNLKGSALFNEYVKAEWNYNTNITDENAQAALEWGQLVGQFSEEAYQNASEFDSTNFSEDTKRQLRFVGAPQLPEEQALELAQIMSQMSSIYATAEVCFEDGECLPLEPDLTDLFATSHDEPRLRFAWTEWHNVVTRQLRPLYVQYMNLKNEQARLRGYTDYGDEMRSRYEMESFEQDMANILEQVRPLYLELHAYIRRRLYDQYGSVVDLEGPIPGHLLGDMWGRFWNNLYNLSQPFPGAGAVDPTEELQNQGYTPTDMFRLGDEFYQSMGLKPVPGSFWELSMLEKPDDGREVVCHATAWDFYDGKDFRIKMCTVVNFDNFLTIHHEMGHVQYFMQYATAPIVYRDGAHDGFHEAIGEVMSMSVATPKHLQGLGLLPDYQDNEETDINFLLQMSLSSLSTLPFHYVMDRWRWEAFREEITQDEWNARFWELKEQYVGVQAPSPRTEDELDVVAIFHVANDYDMMRYFTRTIMQFQFQATLCQEAGHVGPLYKCDFGNSTAAGEKLAAMLRLGKSVPWPDALEQLTGTREMDVQPFLDYFQPLYEWLQEQNAKRDEYIGWKSGDKKVGPGHSRV